MGFRTNVPLSCREHVIRDVARERFLPIVGFTSIHRTSNSSELHSLNIVVRGDIFAAEIVTKHETLHHANGIVFFRFGARAVARGSIHRSQSVEDLVKLRLG